MKNLKEEINSTIEGMLPSMSEESISIYKSLLLVSIIISSVPIIIYFL